MAEGKNVLLGIFAIILGLLVMAFPLISVFTASVLAGFTLIILGIWLFVQSFETWETSKAMSIASLILGVLAVIVGIGLFGRIVAFSIFAGLWFYIGGFFLVITGILSLFSDGSTTSKGAGGAGIILGILYMILGMYAWNPYYLAMLIGLWLIIAGIMEFFKPSE
ncbi:DUF308 domain-containing protein [Methanobacterium aggregans]|uniref:DUF308 domain-containing protein n=1 Tax=Methanobacterium aggregans TaxID=1615586 RepID=UPI001AE8E8B1|nr:DUF308 domain-containing protein [Methanobacterium aggregans]MBP2045114.1 uncharacterized membrane protein HdeD (DUF308 family) [Methanobacterium aggregans]